ncbi:unnamed protein product [Cyclocybe aegerita]|uniref:F-box domain-containing protein n=1 Tax=Cyclocybe aegerita TaxID=1973307 RepID=A0A8S0WPQ4_CYCAE|nr:unnamed protein product [Cyclocybe aegerita]
MAAVSLLALPAELELEIMSILDAGPMLCLALSCRAFQELFKSPAIQYAYELRLTVMQDNGTNIPLETLHSRLQRLRKSWEWLNWTFGGTVKLPGILEAYELRSGIFAKIDRPGTFLSICGLSSATRTGHPCSVRSLGFRADKFAIDPSQDLIAILEEIRLPNGEKHVQVHARRISTDDIHPNAKVDGFHLDFVQRFLIYEPTSHDFPPDVYNFEMLSKDAFILMSVSGPGKIHVCKFSPTCPATPTVVATLLLPPTASSKVDFFVTHSVRLPECLTPGTLLMPVPHSRIHVFTGTRPTQTSPIRSLCTVGRSFAAYSGLTTKLESKRYPGTIGAYMTLGSRSIDRKWAHPALRMVIAYYVGHSIT